MPNHFSEVPRLLQETTKTGCTVVLAAAAPMDRHGYFSLGVSCDYVGPFIGKLPFFLEVNEQMPRTFGRNQVHVSQVAGWVEVDRPLVEVAPGLRGKGRDAARAMSDEGARVLAAVPRNPHVVSLDGRGKPRVALAELRVPATSPISYPR